MKLISDILRLDDNGRRLLLLIVICCLSLC
jgi:hypothetical protein